MPAEVAIWTRVIEPGAELEIEAPVSLLITGAALPAKLNSTTGRTSVELTYTPVDLDDASDDEGDGDAKPTSIILCTLIPEKVEQSLLNMTIPGDNKVTFKVIGKNAVHLTGNYIDDDDDLSPSEGDESDDDEEGYALDEISSDVEMDPDMLDDAEMDSDDEERAHIEEVEEDEEAKAKPASTSDSKKRSRESDAGDEEATESASMSKKQLKKLAKKMKGENGDAKPAPSTEAKEEKSEKKAEKKEKKEKKKEGNEMVTSSSGLKTMDVKTGEGKKAKKGDLLSMRYIGKFPNGKIFDSNTKGKPFQFRLGAGEVIKGWDEGVAGMMKGSERLVIVPPELGYGKKTSGPIPGNSTLHFEIKLLDIKN